MTRVIGNRTQSRICGSRYRETLLIDPLLAWLGTIHEDNHNNTDGVLEDMTVGTRLARLPLLVGHIAAVATLSSHTTMDNSPTALFDTYEQDFRQILDSVRSKLDGDGKDDRGGGINAYYSLC